MIIPDANLIIYAHNQSDPDHAAALAWWKSLLAGDVDVGIPIVIVLAFLRLTTSPRILSKPLSVEDSARRVETWFGSRKMGRSSFRPPARMLNGHWVEAENQFRVIGGGVSGLKSSRRSSPLHGHNGRHIRQFRSVRGLRSAIRGARDRHSRSGSRVQSHFGAVATHASAQRRR